LNDASAHKRYPLTSAKTKSEACFTGFAFRSPAHMLSRYLFSAADKQAIYFPRRIGKLFIFRGG
jgi:hypothetical protein